MKDMSLERFRCKHLKGEDAMRWDLCIARHLAARENPKRSPCKKCTRPAEFVKMLVTEVL